MFRNLSGLVCVGGGMFWVMLLAVAVTFPEKEVKLGEALLKDRFSEQPGGEWQAQREWLGAFHQTFAPGEPLRYELGEMPTREAKALPGGVIVVSAQLMRQSQEDVVEALALATAHALLRHGWRGERVWLPDFRREEVTAAESFAASRLAGKQFPALPPSRPPSPVGPRKTAPSLMRPATPRW